MILNLTHTIAVECKLTIFADWQLTRGLVVQGTIQLPISRPSRLALNSFCKLFCELDEQYFRPVHGVKTLFSIKRPGFDVLGLLIMPIYCNSFI